MRGSEAHKLVMQYTTSKDKKCKEGVCSSIKHFLQESVGKKVQKLTENKIHYG